MAYREFAVPPRLTALVECGWTVARPPGEQPGPVLPDACMDLVWTGADLLVAGPDTTAHPAAGGPVATGLRFRPGRLAGLLAVPADALRDRRVPLGELHPALARSAVARLADGAPAPAVLTALAGALPGSAPDAGVAAVIARVRAAGSAAATADALGLTTRTLHRRCLAAFGYGPAVLRRVLRFRHAVALLHAGVAPAEAAARAGYADQPHLSREVRALAGVAPRQLASGANRLTSLPSGSATTA